MLVYLVTNKMNNKSYIGITTRNISRRWYEHKYVKNSCGKLLSKAIEKYGEESFEIQPLASAIDNIENLKELEKVLIEQCQTLVPNGYNLTAGGDGVFGYKHTKEQRQKITESRKGYVCSEETKARMSKSHTGENNHFYGKEHSEETKKRISDAKKGCVGPWQGKQRDEETREKISESLKGRAPPNKGKVYSEEQRKKLSEAQKNRKPITEETKKKLAEATRLSWIARHEKMKQGV